MRGEPRLALLDSRGSICDIHMIKERTIKKTGKYYLYFLRWIVIAIVLGAVGGAIGSIFHHCIDEVTLLRGEFPWLLYLLPIAGLIIVFIYRKAGFEKDPGTNLVLTSTHTKETVPLRMLPLIFVSTILTHLTGGSAGREGAALQVGGSLGSALGKLLKFKWEDINITILCGMSAVFSAMFGTPIAAAVFSMEVAMVGAIQYAALVPCIVSAVVAKYVAGLMGSKVTIYAVTLDVPITPALIFQTIVLGILCGILSMVFCSMMHKMSHILAKWMPDPYIRVFIGGCMIVALTLMLGNRDYNGAGTHMIEQSFTGQVVWYAFLIKMLFTAITIGSGYKGGEIVPTLFIGATFGCVIGPVLGLQSSLAAAVAMIATFCGVVNAPLASIFLGVEMFGTGDIVLFAIVCAISYVCSGYYSLYSSQTIIQDKLYQHDIFKKAD